MTDLVPALLAGGFFLATWLLIALLARLIEVKS